MQRDGAGATLAAVRNGDCATVAARRSQSGTWREQGQREKRAADTRTQRTRAAPPVA